MENLIAEGVWKPLMGSSSSEMLIDAFGYDVKRGYSGYTPGEAGYAGVGTAAIGGLRNLGGSGSVSTLPGGAKSLTEWRTGVKQSATTTVNAAKQSAQIQNQSTVKNTGAWDAMYKQLGDFEKANTYQLIDKWLDAGLAYDYESLQTCGIWDETQSRVRTDSEFIHEMQVKAAQMEADKGKMIKDTWGGHIMNASVKISEGLVDWSEESAKHAENMKTWDGLLEKEIAFKAGSMIGMGGMSIGGSVNVGGGEWQPAISSMGLGSLSPAAMALLQSTAISQRVALGGTKTSAGTISGLSKMVPGTSALAGWGSGNSIGGSYGSAYGGWYTGGAGIANNTGWGAQASGYASNYSSGSIGSFSWGKFAEGGIVTKPTLALIGEAGEREAVVPLSKAAEMGFGGAGNMVGHSHPIVLDGRVLGQAAGKYVVNEARKSGMKVR
jgi:hypothetical protein